MSKISKMSNMSKGITIIVFCLLFSAATPTYSSELTKCRAIDAIIGEAENQGSYGMKAVAHALRNRKTFRGVYGEKSPRIRYHLYSARILVQAVKAWEESAHEKDFTHGANSWYSEDDIKHDPSIMDRCDFKGKFVDQYFFKCKL